MAINISYQDTTLASFTSGSKVLKTAGKYLVDDITIEASSDSGSGGSGGSITLQAKTNITPTTSSQTITADNGYDGLSSVQINAIPNNYVIPTGTKSITTNGTGIDVAGYATVDVNVSSGGASPATQHTLYLEFSDNTNTTIPIYCNDSIITTLITDSPPPISYNGKIINSATFDGTTWYMGGTWQTLAEGSVNMNPNGNDEPGCYVWIAELGDVYPLDGSIWRITLFGTTYIETAHSATLGNGATTVIVGNPLWSGGTDNGSTMPVNFYNYGWGAWVGDTQLPSGSMPFKIEQLVTS